MSPIEFQAPWARSLKFTTSFTVTLLCGIFALGIVHGGAFGLWKQSALIGFPIFVALGTLPFAVTGYKLTQDEILVKRFGWTTHLPLASLQAVEGKADAMFTAIRVFANGGMFSYVGFYWSRQLGLFRALATDPSRAVLLRYPNRTIAITPHDPQQFIMRARTMMKTSSYRA